MDRRTRIRLRPVVVGPAAAVVAAVLVAELATGSSHRTAPEAAAVRAVASGPAPGFRLASLDGHGTVSLPTSAEPVILNFFASWCEGCQTEMAAMSRLQARAQGRVRIVGIDVSDDRQAARALVARDHIAYPVAVDRGYRTAEAYRLVGLPTTVYLDGRHQVVGTTVGPLTGVVADAWLGVLEADAA